LDYYSSARQLAKAIAIGETSSQELVESVLARIKDHDAKMRAFISVYPERARMSAKKADETIRQHAPLSPLHGVPVALKDIVNLKGRVTTAGSQVWHDRVAGNTALLAQHLERAGMIIIGKTSMVEFGLGGWGTNQLMGTPWNPWDPNRHRTPGGSSSGSAVSVAAGLVPCALGADSGGSIRIPASWCGVVGLKPSVGRIDMSGLIPLTRSFDTAGPLARTVEDVYLLDRILANGTLGHSEEAHAELEAGITGFRLASLSEEELDVVSPDVLTNYQASLKVLESFGASIVQVRLPCSLETASRITGDILSYEAYSLLGSLAEQPDLAIDTNVRSRIMNGKGISIRAYRRAVQQRISISRLFDEALAGVDALLTPTTTTGAIPLEDVDEQATASIFTRFVNLLDFCALALPNGFTADGLPTSLQVVAPRYGEATALRVGWAYESATRWNTWRPPGSSPSTV
jgi:aspartyl-tRNA(Asn)/glutamyl-tRNA(Gln) amidotransferase subunit A